MAKSSIHIIAVKSNSELHNKRLKKYDYVREDLTHLNESWEIESLSSARQRIQTTYEKNVGQKMQKKMNPLREGVLNLNPEHTMEDLHTLREVLFERFGIKTIQMYIHRDEGYMKSKEWKQNLHAHLVFDWTDEKGKSLNLKRQKMTELQDVVAEVLGMERGEKSNKKHLNAIGYKINQIEQDIAQKQAEIKKLKTKWGFYKEIETSANPKDYIQKSFFGLKNQVNEKKLTELIRSEKAKVVENHQLKQKAQEVINRSEQMTNSVLLQVSELEKERQKLEKEKDDFILQKQNFIQKANNLAHQQKKLENFELKMAEFEQMKLKFEKVKDFEDLNYSRKYLDYCIEAQKHLDKILVPQILEKLTNQYSFRSFSDLEKKFIEVLENKGLKYFDTTQEILKETTEKIGIEYLHTRGRKM